MKKSLAFLLFSFLTPLAHGQSSPSSDVYYLYLIGDAGEPFIDNINYKRLLHNKITENADIPSSIVFLGDNIYPKGMPDHSNPNIGRYEKVIRDQIDLAQGINGNIYFIPGNHDWKKGGREGLQYIQNQKSFLDSLHQSNLHFFPENGCPGPVEIALSNNLVLVIIDSQWWLHPWDKPQGETSTCESKTITDVVTELDDILRRNKNKQVVITAHHPILTYGEHGGVFTLKDHLFPLTMVNKNLYVPLPGIGSVYPLYRKFVGNIQDVAHPQYKMFRKLLTEVMEQYPGVVFASGHEHALEYSWRDSVHYVVSGSGSKATVVKKKGFARLAESKIGFARIAITNAGEKRIEYFSAESDSPLYSVNEKLSVKAQNENTIPDLPAEIIAKASSRYGATDRHARWFGENYRKEWETPIKVPVFDFKSEGGDLKIVQRGGGMQTLSLRLEDQKGNQYTLRSIEKFPEKAIPEPFRKTFAQDIVQDQISASHPYGAIVIPSLAKAAGIYHTNPTVVFLADDPRLGEYQKDFANQMMLFEERPEGSGQGKESFGSPDKIISTAKLLEKLEKDNDNRVDEKFVLRSRIFDLWIGDWDRHDDQWRWAEFEDKKGNTYRPIPRDRDQAFFVNQGRIPKIFSRRWALPKFQGFDEELDWPAGFMFNGRYFDRNFLVELSREDWIKQADDLLGKLTDETIESSIKQWPKEIYDLHGEEIVRKLKARRAKLKEYALQHYEFLSKEVTVVGSGKKELFEIEYQPSGNVKIQMFKITKEGDKGKKLYEREFVIKETKEVRLYGRGDDDRFVVKGNKIRGSVKVRVIGGGGMDKVESTVQRPPVFFYDVKDSIEVAQDTRLHDRTSNNSSVNNYDRREFQYDRLAPLVYGNFNVDDGIFLGGGFLATTNGFRKTPFKSRHMLLGSYALNTNSFNLKYDGRFTELIGKWNFEIDADIKSPNYVNNFFGLGNESVFNKDIDDAAGIDVDHAIEYYRLRFKDISTEFKIARTFGQAFFVKLGIAYQRVELEDPEDEDRFIKDYNATLPESILEVGKQFAGATYSWGFDKRNDPVFTTRGIYLEQKSKYMGSLNSSDQRFSYHTAGISFYQSFRFPAKVTFAVRAGGGLNTGDYQIYQSQILDGKTELRGFRKTRFYGDSKLYFNNEIRLKLASFRSYLFPASIGITGFFDVGRVWYKNAAGIDPTSASGKSSVWHKGYGGGIWFTPFNLTVITTEVGHSKEGTLAYIRLGFLF